MVPDIGLRSTDHGRFRFRVLYQHLVSHEGKLFAKDFQQMIKALRQLRQFDPEHLHEEILLTEAFHSRFPDLPQIACFSPRHATSGSLAADPAKVRDRPIYD